MPTYPEYLIRRFPEHPRRRVLTARPKAAKPCIWQRIARAESRMIGLTLAASKMEAR
ncbi:hypothetical protein [Acidiphilium sp.]|uniref:hypothetical protein n=1 Tax=Acidiphilium sp. TaxID=527 RepID=UPI002588AAB6|nr:hypothetical protein [Acidiphilium sp.]